jgi:toxin ParE1/3/4
VAQVSRRPQAALDILDIWGYIAADSEVAADRWVDELDEKMRLWAAQPLIGRSRDELAPGLSSLAFGRYVVFYEVLSEGIDVLRVLHGSRDIDANF